MKAATHRLVTIAVADDDIVDRMTVARAIQKAGLANPVVEVSDGQQLLALLRGQSPYEGTDRPGLVVLDLNMPRVDGRQVLAEIADDPSLSHIPIIVLTVSDATEDIRNAYLDGAVSFVTKPVTFDALRRIIDGLQGFAMGIVSEA